MRRNPLAYARLANCEKSSFSISSSRPGLILVSRPASSRVRFRAKRASFSFLPRPSMKIRPAPGLHRGVEVDENLARLRALAWSQYAALLQNINDSRRARVAQAE